MKTLITGIVALGALAATAENQAIEQSNNRTILFHLSFPFNSLSSHSHTLNSFRHI